MQIFVLGIVYLFRVSCLKHSRKMIIFVSNMKEVNEKKNCDILDSAFSFSIPLCSDRIHSINNEE